MAVKIDADKRGKRNSRQGSTSRHRTRSSASSMRQPAGPSVPDHRDLHRAAEFGIARPALVDVDLKNGELHVRQRPTAIARSASPNPKLASAHPAGAARREHVEGVAAGLPKGRARSGLSKQQRQAVGSRRYRHAHPVADGGQGWRCRCQGRGEVSGPACVPALLRFMAASTGRRTAGWNCRSRPCRRAWGTPRLSMTSDVYGHLFPRSDDGSEMAEAEKLLLA